MISPEREEQYDVLDEEGNKTGQALPKSVVHERELWHGSAFVWIYNAGGEVLLQLRAPGKKIFANVWDVSVAGHMSAGDSPMVCAIREINEEIGVSIQPDQLTPIGEYKDIVHYPNGKPHKEHCWVFLLKLSKEAKDLTPQVTEVSELKWHPVSELVRDLNEPTKAKQYTTRNPYIYEIAIKEVPKILKKSV